MIIRTNLLALLFLLFSATGFSQEMSYEVYGSKAKPVMQEKLDIAQTMIDINPDYPSSWIQEADYISSEISTTQNDEVMKAEGKNNVLSTDQKNLLVKAEVGQDIDVAVKYNYKNAVTGQMTIKTMNFSVRVAPKIEAEFVGGYDALKQYLKENAVDKLSLLSLKELKMAVVNFSVDESGEISNTHISTSSEDDRIDEFLLKVINEMPKWRPAEDAHGVKVKQTFEFNIGNQGC